MLSLAQSVERILGSAEGILSPDHIAKTRCSLAEWAGSAQARILVFGLFNAGKSTLVSALTGASMELGAIPTTQAVVGIAHPYGEYLLLDAPGLGAPGLGRDAAVREAADWNADLVLLVFGDGHHLEHKGLWDELRRFARRGKPLLLVFNEKDPTAFAQESGLSEAICRSAKGRLQAAGLVSDLIQGPLFVNALSALNARRSGAAKPLLEARSGVPLLESRIQEWVIRSGHRVGIVRIVTRVAEQVREARSQLQQDLAGVDAAGSGALAALDQVKAGFKTAVLNRKEDMVESLGRQAVGLLGGTDPGQPERFQATMQQRIDEAYGALGLEAEDNLKALFLEFTGVDFPDPVISRNLLQAPAVPALAPLIGPADPAPDPAAGVLDRHTGPDAGAHEVPGAVTPVIAAGFRACKETGVLRSLGQKGVLGRMTGNAIRFAPAVGMAMDLLTLLGNANPERDQALAQARDELRRQAGREDRARAGVEARARQVIGNAFEHRAQELLQAGFRIIHEVRAEFEVARTVQDTKRASFLERIGRCDTMLDAMETMLGNFDD